MVWDISPRERGVFCPTWADPRLRRLITRRAGASPQPRPTTPTASPLRPLLSWPAVRPASTEAHKNGQPPPARQLCWFSLDDPWGAWRPGVGVGPAAPPGLQVVPTGRRRPQRASIAAGGQLSSISSRCGGWSSRCLRQKPSVKQQAQTRVPPEDHSSSAGAAHPRLPHDPLDPPPPRRHAPVTRSLGPDQQDRDPAAQNAPGSRPCCASTTPPGRLGPQAPPPPQQLPHQPPSAAPARCPSTGSKHAEAGFDGSGAEQTGDGQTLPGRFKAMSSQWC